MPHELVDKTEPAIAIGIRFEDAGHDRFVDGLQDLCRACLARALEQQQVEVAADYRGNTERPAAPLGQIVKTTSDHPVDGAREFKLLGSLEFAETLLAPQKPDQLVDE